MAIRKRVAGETRCVWRGLRRTSWRGLLAPCMALACLACGSHEHGAAAVHTAGADADVGGSAAGKGGGGGEAGELTNRVPRRNGVEGQSGSTAAVAAAAAAAGSSGDASPIVTCGSMPCSAPPPGLMQLAGGLPISGIPVPVACCVDTADGPVCGTAPSAAGSCEPRAIADSRCPSIDPGTLSVFSGGDIAGCCTLGACGIDAALFGRGCIENAAAAAQLAMIPFLGSAVSVPPPRACDVGAAADGQDAGTP